jgi:hypothetical protein
LYLRGTPDHGACVVGKYDKAEAENDRCNQPRTCSVKSGFERQ